MERRIVPETHYTYRGLIVEYWDLLRGDTSRWSSRPYFLKLIQDSGQPVLDVACGTGRLLISPEMIDLCRANADRAGLKPNLYAHAMQTLELPRRYQTIIAVHCRAAGCGDRRWSADGTLAP
jgi:SAM-dependent methyltransferase